MTICNGNSNGNSNNYQLLDVKTAIGHQTFTAKSDRWKDDFYFLGYLLLVPIIILSPGIAKLDKTKFHK